MLCPPVYITQAGGGVLAVAHITCATPSSVKRDSPVLPTRLLPAGFKYLLYKIGKTYGDSFEFQ